MRPRLLLADEETLTREGLRLMLEPEFEIVESVENGRALLEAALKVKPDVILLDISIPVLNGIDAARRLRKDVPSAKLIFVTAQADADYVTEAFRAGAAGYVSKRAEPSELITAVREAVRGNKYISPIVAREAMGRWMSAGGEGRRPGKELTPRQTEVLQLTAEGRSRKEIAAMLKISVKTVEFHKAVLMRELNLKTVADFTRYAIEHGMIFTKRG